MNLDIQELIVDRLRAIQNTAEKDALRTVLEGVFLPLHDTVMEKYDALEKRIYDEMPFHPTSYTIRSTLMPRSEAKDITWLFPMIEKDIQPEPKTWGAFQEELAQNNEAILDTIFLEADYLSCQEIEESRQYYPATLIVGGHTITVRVRLRMANRYQEKSKELYGHFLANGIPWATPNISYCYKLFDVVVAMVETTREVDKDEFVEVYYDFKKFIGSYQRDLVPVWNIHDHEVDETIFPVPALDKVNYEYKYLLPDAAVQDGYLVNLDNPQLITMRREPQALVAVSPARTGLHWSLLQINQRSPSATERFAYPLISNKQQDSFAARMLSSYGTQVKTQGELVRLIYSFDAAEALIYDSFFISTQPVKGETYDINHFLRDEMRDRQEIKTMVLRFREKKKGDIYNRDILSFLVSQVQLVYPEYNCVGALL